MAEATVGVLRHRCRLPCSTDHQRGGHAEVGVHRLSSSREPGVVAEERSQELRHVQRVEPGTLGFTRRWSARLHRGLRR